MQKVTVTKGKKFVVLGAGGAARAFVFEILESVSNPSITILNRHLSKALEVKKDAEELGYSGIRALKLDDTNLELALGSADIVANATNITLENASATPVPKRLLKKGMVVFDANYVPLENRLVRVMPFMPVPRIMSIIGFRDSGGTSNARNTASMPSFLNAALCMAGESEWRAGIPIIQKRSVRLPLMRFEYLTPVGVVPLLSAILMPIIL